MVIKSAKPRGSWSTPAILCGAALFAAADRALPGLLMEPIKHSLALTDSQIAMLTGFSFAISMSVFALPLAWIADRFSRKVLLITAITVWCLMTIASGFASNFAWLFILRMGVGIGEAALHPAGYSLLADLFPVSRLAKPLGAMALAGVLGGVLANIGGGALYEGLRHAFASGILTGRADDAWRWTTAILGAVGMLVPFAAIGLLHDPRKSLPDISALPAPPLKLVDYLRKSAFFTVPYTLGLCFFCLFASGFSDWLAPFFVRQYGWSVGQVGRTLGFVALASGLLGAPLGVLLSRVVVKVVGRPAPVAAISVALAASLPFVFLGPLAPSGLLAAAAITVAKICSGAATVIGPVVFTSTAPPPVRARMIAVSNLCFGLLGTSLGGIAYASFTEHVLRNSASLGVTLSFLSTALLMLSIGTIVMAHRRYSAAVDLAAPSAVLVQTQNPLFSGLHGYTKL